MKVSDTDVGAGTRWIAVADAAALRREAYRRIVEAADRAIKQHGRFRFVLAGGNTPRGVYRMLRGANTDWSRWQIYFGDERCLPADDPERNSRSADDTWLDHVAIPKDNVHAIPAELGADAAALAYARTLEDLDNFDLVLLGLGEDGHTASLFPGHDCGIAADAPDVLPVFGAPKPPAQRVSLSTARLSRSSEVLFLIEGESKRNAVTRWHAGEQLPATAIRPTAGVDVLVEISLLRTVAI
jgi:6-phosphogluconolactonase